MRQEQLLIGGRWLDGDGGSATRRDPYRDVAVAAVAQASTAQADAAVAAARAAFEAGPPGPHRRFELLCRAAALLDERRQTVLADLIAESGFSRGDARNEVDRCIRTLQLCGEEAKRVTGECVPMDAAPGAEQRLGFTLRVPRGVVCAITPFNSPLNTVAHKIAPALAAGNAVVLKPAAQTPISANHLGRILADAGLPAGLLNAVHGSGEVIGERLLENPDIDFYGFTGSSAVGERIRQRIGLRHASLELGSISSTIVCESADLALATPKIIAGGFRKAGQVCTSIQRLFVQRCIVPELLERLGESAGALKAGDPMRPDTDIGPLIDRDAAVRVEDWIREAVDGGAGRLVGGDRHGAVLPATILTDVPPACRIMREEVFGPVFCVIPFDTLPEALAGANDSPYGLTAGVFTRDLDEALMAARRLRVGSLHVNETSSARVDQMPSGGVKRSGMGREGPRYAVREMTEERLITISPGTSG